MTALYAPGIEPIYTRCDECNCRVQPDALHNVFLDVRFRVAESRMCPDCIAQLGDSVKCCADCGDYWSTSFQPDFFGGGLCDSCQQERDETREVLGE